MNVLKNTQEIDLDIRNIQVSRAMYENTELTFKIVKYEKLTHTLGDQLKISLASPVEAGKTVQLTVEFYTLESKESALNWLTPSQTEGREPNLITN